MLIIDFCLSQSQVFGLAYYDVKAGHETLLTVFLDSFSFVQKPHRKRKQAVVSFLGYRFVLYMVRVFLWYLERKTPFKIKRAGIARYLSVF